MGILGSVAAPAALPAHIPLETGLAVYGAIARIAAFPFVRQMIARADVDSGRLDDAAAQIDRLPPSAERSDLQARLWSRQGRTDASTAAYLEAGDADAVEARIDALRAQGDVEGARALARSLAARLVGDRTGRAAYAEARWKLGVLEGGAQGSRDFDAAVALAPFDVKYLLDAAFGALANGDRALARSYLDRLRAIDPDSSDVRLLASRLQ